MKRPRLTQKEAREVLREYLASNTPPEIEKFDKVAKINCRGQLGSLVGKTKDGRFFAVDFGDGELKYVATDSPGWVVENSVN